jgi:hypothetical protein
MRRATAHCSRSLVERGIIRRPPSLHGTQLGLVNRVSSETTNVPAIDMRSITQLAEIEEAGDQFVAEIIKVFLADLSERVRAIGLRMSRNDLVGIEDRTKRDPTGDLQPAIDSMVAETERVRAALEAYQADHAPR